MYKLTERNNFELKIILAKNTIPRDDALENVIDSQNVTITCPLTTLKVGERMTCKGKGTASEGLYSNLGTVTARSPEGTTVSDEDPSHYFGEAAPAEEHPSIDIEKYTNEEDADTPTGPYITVGDDVSWTYVVYNDGDVLLTEIVVTDVQIKPSNIEIQGIRYQFVYHKKDRFFGVKNTWIDDYNKVKCSDLEKTLVDSFVNPQYSNGIVEIAKSVHEARNKIDLGKIMDYFTMSGSKVAARRYVFICNLLEINSSYHESLLQNSLTGSFLRLDTSAPDEGKINTRYELKINRDINTIKEAIYT